MKTYNVGFIGFGFIGKVHAYGYINLPLFYDPIPLRAKLTHVCTSRMETAEQGCAVIGADHPTTDYTDISENPEIDIVHICTPNHLHKDALLSAMHNGKHIYCDKPITATLSEAEEVRAALDEYWGTAQMTFQNRFFSSIIRAKQLIDEGAVGRVLEFRVVYLHAGSANPDAPLKWKLSAEAGGGVIADLGSHAIDLAHYLLGDFESILADTKIAFPERPSVEDPAVRVNVDAEDCVMMLARMKSGALGHIEATKLATGTEDEVRVEIHGEKGALRFNSMAPHFLEFFDAMVEGAPVGGVRGWTRIDVGQRYPAPANGFPSPKNSIGWMRVHMACLANFLQSIAEGAPGDPGLSQGIYIQRLMEHARRSARERAWVDC